MISLAALSRAISAARSTARYEDCDPSVPTSTVW
jgi:hypothetical protein